MDKVFQAWWNNRYFHTTHPLYTTYKRLQGLGADLDYVEFLCDMLSLGDYLQLMRPRTNVGRKQDVVTAFLKKRGDEFSSFLQFFATIVARVASIELFEKRHAADKVFDPLSNQNVKNILSKSFLLLGGSMLDNAVKKAELKQAQRIQQRHQVETDSENAPVIRLIRAYNPPAPLTRGNKADPWGSLFLLAVTEHLRKKTETGKPHYGEAVKLLQKKRAELKDFSPQRPLHFRRTNAQSAVVRIAGFKRANPLWNAALKSLQDQFLLSSKTSN